LQNRQTLKPDPEPDTKPSKAIKVEEDTLLDQPNANPPAALPVSHPDLNISESTTKTDNGKTDTPQSTEKNPPKKIEDAIDVPAVDPLPGTIKEEVKKEEKTTEDKLTEEESKTEEKTKNESEPEEKTADDSKDTQDIPDTPAPSKERFSAIDALPDPGEKVAAEAKDNMQDPKIFDTKEYYVPIGNTHHGHGHLKAALLFGVIFAIIIIGGAIYTMSRLAK
jgi:hypothetical protein